MQIPYCCEFHLSSPREFHLYQFQLASASEIKLEIEMSIILLKIVGAGKTSSSHLIDFVVKQGQIPNVLRLAIVVAVVFIYFSALNRCIAIAAIRLLRRHREALLHFYRLLEKSFSYVLQCTRKIRHCRALA